MTNKKFRQTRKRYNHTKAVGQFDLEGNFIAKFNTAEEATEKTGVYFSNIREVCNAKRKTAGGFIWRYITFDLDPDLYDNCNHCGKPVEKRDIIKIGVGCLQALKNLPAYEV